MNRRSKQKISPVFPVPKGYLKNVEMATEGNYNMIGDDLINNTMPARDDLTDGQTWEEMRNLAPETLPEAKQSVFDLLEQMRTQSRALYEPADPADTSIEREL